jgi:nitrogen regulatory protein PII
MKMLMVLVPSDCLADVQNVIDKHEIHAYTEIPNVLGSGKSGRKLGTRAFPGTTSMLLAIVSAEEADRLVAAVREYATQAQCCEEIRVFAMPAEAMA